MARKMEQMETNMKKRRGRIPLIVVAVLAGMAAAGYLGLCGYASASGTIWQNTFILGQAVGGLTPAQAAQKLEEAFPDLTLSLYLYDRSAAPDRAGAPDAEVAVSDLGGRMDAQRLADGAYAAPRSSFLASGWKLLASALRSEATNYAGAGVELDGERTRATAQQAAGSLSSEARNTGYETGDSALLVNMALDGRQVDPAALERQFTGLSWTADLAVDAPYDVLPAQTMTAQSIYDQISGEVQNAGYDAATQSITPERMGADFDVARAQQLMDAADPGETVSIPAELQAPTVTAEELKQVLFRDLLGTCTTHVGGTAARKSNVALASAAVNGTVLNAGDVFSYNGVVGQRTAAKGYQAAPAYVRGETVDEIGGGVCQPSSTLYLACLNSNLEITERYAHRYTPSYIPWGMDATVSWGGPDYQFRNDTDYPVRVEAVYKKGYLTMNLYGTKASNFTVKMTGKTLSTSEPQTVYEDDAALAPGTETVKVTPYTGHKVQTFRSVYEDGKLVSSEYEATSNYQMRNQVILRGPVVEIPVYGGAALPEEGTGFPPATPEAPADIEPSVPAEAPVPLPETPPPPTGFLDLDLTPLP